MISARDLIERLQKNVGVQWQSQRSDGFSDGILLGNADAAVTGIVNTFAPTLEVLRKAVGSGKNTIVCREAPFYSRGERAPLFWRNGPAPSKELIENDAVCQAKQAGMDECARWLQSFVSEVPIKFIPSADPFWMPA